MSNKPIASLFRRGLLLPASLAAFLAVSASPILAAPPPLAKKLLVVSVTKGYRHASIPTMERVIEQLGAESGAYTVSFARTDLDLTTMMTAAALVEYDGVLFASTTGDLVLPDREAFMAWIESGKAFIGVHSASDTFHSYRPFIEMLGGEFDYHRKQATVRFVVDDPKHPAAATIPKDNEVLDEIYLFKSFNRARIHSILSLDRHPNHDEKGFYPLAWTRQQGRGRVFYTALGHREDVLEAAWFKSHLLGGVSWALAARGESPVAPQARDSSSDQGAGPKEYREYFEVQQRRAGGEGPLPALPDFHHGLLERPGVANKEKP